MIELDCHTHSELSPCAEDITLEKSASFAKRNNLHFVVSDHSYVFYFNKGIRRKAEEKGINLFTDKEGIEIFRQIRKEKRQEIKENILKHHQKIMSYRNEGAIPGVEIDILSNGQLVFEEEFMGKFPALIGGLHYLKVEKDNFEKRFKSQILSFMGQGINLLAHPFRILLSKGLLIKDSLIFWTVEKAKEYNVALEVNSHFRFPEIDKKMCKWCIKKGVKIAISTDSHRVSEFGDFSYHYKMLSPYLKREELFFKPLF